MGNGLVRHRRSSIRPPRNRPGPTWDRRGEVGVQRDSDSLVVSICARSNNTFVNKSRLAFSPTEIGRASLLCRAERVRFETVYAVNEEPQPQLPVEFGFLNVKPEPI